MHATQWSIAAVNPDGVGGVGTGEKHIDQLDLEAMELMKGQEEAGQRVAEMPGFGVHSALQAIGRSGR
jgi:hypothetical protein